MSLKFMEVFADYVDWELISKTITLTDIAIETFQDRLNFLTMSIYQTPSENNIVKFCYQVREELVCICRYQKSSDELIIKCIDCVYPIILFQNQILSERTIDKLLKIKHCNSTYSIMEFYFRKSN